MRSTLSRIGLFALLLCSIAARQPLLADPTPIAGETVELGTKWKIGTTQRYDVTWQREAAIDSDRLATSPNRDSAMSLVDSMNSRLSGEIELTVSKGPSDGAYQVRWQPVLAPFTALPDDADAAAIGKRFRDVSLSIPLTLIVEPGRSPVGIQLLDAGGVRQRLLQALRQLSAKAPLVADCARSDLQDTTICRLLASDESVSAFLLRDVAPLFACNGVRLNTRHAEDWNTPHPSPEVGDAVKILHHQAAIDYRAGATELRVRITTTPDAGQLRAWMRKRLAGSPEPLIQQIVDNSAYQESVDCTMDQKLGWPSRLERRMSAGSGPLRGMETVRFERKAAKDAAQRPGRSR
ncbi:MAG: hypothetical protein ABI411_06690 [Tahibacter sp.]